MSVPYLRYTFALPSLTPLPLQSLRYSCRVWRRQSLEGAVCAVEREWATALVGLGVLVLAYCSLKERESSQIKKRKERGWEFAYNIHHTHTHLIHLWFV